MKHVIGGLALAASALCASGAALAQAAPAAPQAPPQLPPGISQSSAGSFKVVQIATTDARGFLAAWQQRKGNVRLPYSGATQRGRPIDIYLIFAGCKTGDSGSCNVVTDFEFYDPDGGVYSRQTAIPQWLGPSAPGDQFMLGTSGRGLTIETGEKLGVYRIRTFTTDKVANVTVSNEIAVTVTEAAK